MSTSMFLALYPLKKDDTPDKIIYAYPGGGADEFLLKYEPKKSNQCLAVTSATWNTSLPTTASKSGGGGTPPSLLVTIPIDRSLPLILEAFNNMGRFNVHLFEMDDAAGSMHSKEERKKLAAGGFENLRTTLMTNAALSSITLSHSAHGSNANLIFQAEKIFIEDHVISKHFVYDIHEG